MGTIPRDVIDPRFWHCASEDDDESIAWHGSRIRALLDTVVEMLIDGLSVMTSSGTANGAIGNEAKVEWIPTKTSVK